MLRRTLPIRTSIINISTITDIAFSRPRNSADTNQPIQFSPIEAAYDSFAEAHGLCSVKDFYRGVGQSYYSLATTIHQYDSASPSGSSFPIVSPVATLQKQLDKMPKPITMSSNNNSNETTTTNKTDEDSNKSKKNAIEGNTNNNIEDQYSPKNMENFRNNKIILDRIFKTQKENVLFDAEEYKKFIQTTSFEWPKPDTYSKDSADKISFVESVVESSTSTTKKDEKSKNENKSKTTTVNPSSSISFTVALIRSIFAPIFRHSLYHFGPWNTSYINQFSAAATTGYPLATPSHQTAERLYEMLASADEKIDAIQMSSFELIPKEKLQTATKHEEGENEKENEKEKEIAVADKTENKQDESESTKEYIPKSFNEMLIDESGNTIPIDEQRMKDVSQRFDIAVSVNLLVQIPPARYCHNYAYFRERMRTDGEDLEDHFAGNKDAVISAANSTARILAVSNVYNTFKVLEWIGRKLFKTPIRLDPRAMPHHLLGLSEAFPSQPCRYVKSVTMVYNQELKHWRIANWQLNGHYLKDFDAEDWKANHGGTIY